jgi:hypothetical protein
VMTNESKILSSAQRTLLAYWAMLSWMVEFYS